MAYPAGITLRTITCGGAGVLESGADLTLHVVLRASRGLIWDATGTRLPALGEPDESPAPGAEVSFTVPVTDQSGYRDEATGALIDVSAADSHTHTYTATIYVYRDGRSVSQRVVGPFTLPTGDGSPVDLDTLITASTVPGLLVSVPDAWSAQVAQAVAAAGSADAAAASAAAADADRIAADASAASAAASALSADADATIASAAADTATEASDLAVASAALAGIEITPSPDYPGSVLRISYPAHVSPSPHLIRLPIGA